MTSKAFITSPWAKQLRFTASALMELRNTQFYIQGISTDAEIQEAKESWDKLSNLIAKRFDEVPNEFCYEKVQTLTRQKDDQTAP